MQRSHTSRRLALLLLATVAAGVAACTSAKGDAEESADAQAAGDAESLIRVINVTAQFVVRSRFTDYIRVTGQVQAFTDVTLSAEESGRVSAYPVEKGRRVRRGQVVARLDDAVLRAQVAEARASARLAQEQDERQRRLWEEEKIGSEITYLQAKYQAEMQAARLATLEARLERMAIRSPIDGVFDEKFLEVGEMAMPGAQVARVVEIDKLKVSAGIPERFAPYVRPGGQAQVTFDILADRTFAGSVGFVGSTVDERNRTFPIEIVLDNPEGLVKPRMVANVQVVRTTLPDAIAIPQEVVLRREEGYHVYLVVEEEGKLVARARPVTLGPAYGNRVVIEEGLEVGDRLVMAGAKLVDDGRRIRIVNDTDGSGATEGVAR